MKFQGSWHAVERVRTQGSRVHDTLLREFGHKVPGFMTRCWESSDTRFQGSWHAVERVRTRGSVVHDTLLREFRQGSRVHDTLLREFGHKVPEFMTASLSDFSQEMWSLLNCCRGWSSFAWMQLCGSCGWHKELNSGAPDDYSESNSLAIEWW